MNLLDFSKQDRAKMAHKWNDWVTEYYKKEIDYSINHTSRCQFNDAKVDRFPQYNTESFLVDMDTVSCLFKVYDPMYSIGVLNFASYKNPGGMFLNGSPAQEEALCHQSTLYPVLCAFKDEYYNPHLKTLNRALYTDDALYSRNIHFFDYSIVKDDGELAYSIRKVITADVITCAAPNIRTYTRYNEGDYLSRDYLSDECINDAICGRILTVLNAAFLAGCKDLILGAFGCGVFGNNPETIADCFMDYIYDNFGGQFRKVYYAVPKSLNNNNYEMFREVAECPAYNVKELSFK